GLMNAIDRFDPDRGLRFTSFAVPTILGELKRHFRDQGRSVHLPRGLQERVLKVQEAHLTLEARRGRSPTWIEVAEQLGADVEDVLEALDAILAQRPLSLDAPIEGGADEALATRHEIIGGLDEHYALLDSSVTLNAAVRQLPETDQQVLRLRFED